MPKHRQLHHHEGPRPLIAPYLSGQTINTVCAVRQRQFVDAVDLVCRVFMAPRSAIVEAGQRATAAAPLPPLDLKALVDAPAEEIRAAYDASSVY